MSELEQDLSSGLYDEYALDIDTDHDPVWEHVVPVGLRIEDHPSRNPDDDVVRKVIARAELSEYLADLAASRQLR